MTFKIPLLNAKTFKGGFFLIKLTKKDFKKNYVYTIALSKTAPTIIEYLPAIQAVLPSAPDTKQRNGNSSLCGINLFFICFLHRITNKKILR